MSRYLFCFYSVMVLAMTLMAIISIYKQRPEWAAVFIGWTILFRLDKREVE